MNRVANEKTLTKIIIDEQKALQNKPDRRVRPKKPIAETPCVSVKDTPDYEPSVRLMGSRTQYLLV